MIEKNNKDKANKDVKILEKGKYKNKILKQTKNNSKGITLIALVITIIVLLILAGVTIAMLTGENGILTKANSAQTETVSKGAIEKIIWLAIALTLVCIPYPQYSFLDISI